MGKNKNTPQPESIKGSKKIIFYLIAILIPVVLLLLLEISLRLFGYGRDLSLFVKSQDFPGYYEINRGVAKRFFTKFKGTQVSNDIFLIQKPDTAYRVFVMGCSTTRGFPYEMGVTFSRILYYRLQDAFPNKRIEVVNTAMAAVNSYTQLDFIDEILDQKPDAILIYTGHNEYYGALGVGSVESAGNMMWMKSLHLSLLHFRIYQLIQNATNSFSKALANNSSRPSGTLMERIAKEKAIAYGSDLYKEGIQQFALNMDKVINKANKAGVPVIISDVVSNIRDNEPFKSVEAQGKPKAAEMYTIARSYDEKGNFEKAREAYYLAKDLDAIRFRAPEDINEVINNIAKKNNVHFLSMKKIFEEASPNGLVGNNLMTEHLHPNVDGYFLMADAFFNSMRENKFIEDNWDTSKIYPSSYYRKNWGYTELDSTVAQIKIESLKAGWPFKPENVVNRYIYTYVPDNYIDTLAIACVRHDTLYHIEDMHKQLAKYYASKGEFQKAFQEYNSLIHSYPYMGELYVEASNYLLAYSDYKTAINYLMSCPDYKSDYLIYNKIAKIYFKNMQFPQAIQNYKMAIELAPKDADLSKIYISLYRLYKETRNLKASEEVLKKIREIDPYFKDEEIAVVNYQNDTVSVLISTAKELARNNQLDQSVSILNEAIKIKGTAEGYRILGSIYIKKNDFSNAITNFEKSYKLDPKNESTLHNLFLLTIKLKDFNKATQYLDEFKAVSKDIKRCNEFTKMLVYNVKNSK